jgi:hypothetical protein
MRSIIERYFHFLAGAIAIFACSGLVNPSAFAQATTSWTFCSNEWDVCSFSGTRQVRYGANGTYTFQTATDSIACNNDVFGDPLPGVDKICEYASTSTTAFYTGPISVKHSGKCLDVRGGVTATANGAAIEQWTCTGEANQDWTIKDMGAAQYELIAKHSGKCLDVVNGSTANEALIQQWDCTGQPNQLWYMQSMAAAGDYRFVNVPGGRCLDVRGGVAATGDGALVELWDCTGQDNQTWTIGAPVTQPPTSIGPFGQDASLYTLVFSDEFDGTSLDTSKWGDKMWWLPEDSTPNYAVSNGSLKIWPVAGSDLNRNYRHITTDAKYYQTYGYFEIEAKLPFGRGPWPAFWLYNHDGATRPEIDIMEAYPGGGPDSGWSDANLHATAYAATVWRNDGDLVGTSTLQTVDLSAGYHKYAVKWEPGKQTFYFDGQPFYTLNVAFPDRMFILLSFQFGSASGAPDASTPTGQGNSFDIRYVRAWQFK